jgi:ribosome assembly protein 4
MDIDASASVMCQLLSPEGDPLGSALYLPQNVGPPQLQEIVNQLLHNVLLCSNCFLSHLSNSFILSCFPQPYLSILLLLTHSCILFIQEEKLPYAFYVGDEELSVHLGAYMRQKNGEMRSLSSSSTALRISLSSPDF